MQPAINIFQAAAELMRTSVDHADDHAVFRNVDGVEWNRFSLKQGLTEATYVMPGGNADIEAEMAECLGTEHMFVAYLPIDFFTLPMWPRRAADFKSPFDCIFYTCVQCNCYVGPYAQLCMQFFLPAVMSPLTAANKYPWSWLPRVLCKECAAGAGVGPEETLTYYPFCMYAQRAISREVDAALRQMRSRRALNSISEPHAGAPRECLMCLRQMADGRRRQKGKRKKKKKKKKKEKGEAASGGDGFCSQECADAHAFMAHLLQKSGGQAQDGITGLFQLLELFDVMRTYEVDINKALCWRSVCNNIEGHRGGDSAQEGGNTILCPWCHRVAYCSKKCMREARDGGQHRCNRAEDGWRSVFTPRRLCIQRE